MKNQDWAVGLTEEKAAYATQIAINQVLTDFMKRKHNIDYTGITTAYNKDGKVVAQG